MTSSGLARRRLLAFAGLALVVGAIVGVAVTRGRAPAKAQQVRACVALTADLTHRGRRGGAGRIVCVG